MKTIEIVCKQCGKIFHKSIYEYNRQIRNGRDYFYCGRSCSITAGNQNRHDSDASHLNPRNRHDELTPFRCFQARIRYRKKKGPSDIDVLFLKTLWEKQQGICPFTNFQMILPEGTVGWKNGKT